MSYGGFPYGGVGYAASDVAEIPSADTRTSLSIEVAFTTGALETPVWEDITADVRFWDVQRGRSRELERFQPGRATIVLSNLSRQYDAVYASGPHFGDLRPMRRVRIRETFNGVTYPVFDGFVDRWQLDYPAVGKDATATLTATDAFKIFARTELPPSVYYDTVLADAPDLWWRLNDPQSQFSALDSSGNDATGTPVGSVRFGGETLVVNDPGGSVEIQEAAAGDAYIEGTLPTTLTAATTFSIEFWFKFDVQPGNSANLTFLSHSSAAASAAFQLNPITNKGGWVIGNEAGGSFSAQLDTAFVLGERYHIVATHASDRKIRIYVNGVEGAYSVQDTTTGTINLNQAAVGSPLGLISLECLLDDFSVYSATLSATQAGTHYIAGTAPWAGDDADDRLARILTIAEWPATEQELDDGATTFQSAEIADQTVLEHAQKCAETEFGLLFVNREGKVRFVSRASQFGRLPGPTIYGDGTGEVGYRDIRPDDGDEVIRNSATISRYNGVAKTATGTTIDEFGRFQYTLDGLLHDSDAHSADYADFIVAEYGEPRRRITELTIGPPPDGDEDLYYPAMLGPELGDAISVTHTPQGLGDPFEQTCVVEGIAHSSAPGRNRTTTFTLSPELEAHVGAWQDYTPTNTNVTVGNGTQAARWSRDGKTIHWNYYLEFGSSTAFGGNVEIGLPVSAAFSATRNMGVCWMQDASTGSNNKVGTCFLLSSQGSLVRPVYSGGGTSITASTPFTWTTGDRLVIQGSYEAAF